MPALSSYTLTSAEADDFLRLSGGFRLPEHSSSGIDRNGVTDSTAGLQAFLNDLVSKGDPGYLPSGNYKTSAELVVPPGAGIMLSGGGPRRSVIKTNSTSFNGLRVNLGESFNTQGEIANIGVQGPSSAPTTGSAGYVLGRASMFNTRNVESSGFDMGFDLISNDYDCSFYNLSVPRFDSCNVGINIRKGDVSGSDLHFHDSNIFSRRSALSISNGLTSIHFNGGQISSQSGTFTDFSDDYGVISIGKDYLTGVIDPALGTAMNLSFRDFTIEKPKGNWMIRSFVEFMAVFENFDFIANHPTVGEQCLGVWKGTDVTNSSVLFLNCGIPFGTYWTNPGLCILTNPGTHFQFREEGWRVLNGATINGVAKGTDGWMVAGLMNQSGLTYGHGRFRQGGKEIQRLGSIYIRDNSGALEKSTDLATWTAV